MKNVIILPGAHVLGNIEFGEYCSVWFNAVMRSDLSMKIGNHCNIQDNCVFHADNFPVILGDNVTVGHSAIVHCATIGSNTMIGMGSIILDGAKIGNDCFIGAKSLITKGTVIPDGSLVFGSPAKIIRPINDAERDNIARSAKAYWEVAQKYAEKYNIKWE